MNMGPQADFAGQQILQHLVLGGKCDLFFPAAFGFAQLLVFVAHFRQPAAQDGDRPHAGCGALAFPVAGRHGIIAKSCF